MGIHVRTNTLILALLSGLVLAGPVRAQSDEEALTGSATSEPAPAVPEPLEEAEPVEAPSASVEAPSASEAVIAAIEEAIERLIQLEVGLVAAAAPGSDSARQELAVVRSRLRDALVAIGQLQGEQDLRDWLRAEGLALPAEPAEQTVVVPVEGSARATGALTPTELRALKGRIESAPFNEGKLQSLRQGLQGRQVTSTEAASLLELFSFSRDRVDALVFLHPRIADEENFDVLLSALKFESDRKAVRDRLGLGG